MRILYDRPATGTKYFQVFLDEYMYASMLANKDRAEYCVENNNIDHYFCREGWISLLLHYVECINCLIDEFPNSITYIDVIAYNKLLIIKNNVTLKVKNYNPMHILPIDDVDICRYTIDAIKIMQTIFDIELSLDYLKIEYLKIRNLESINSYNYLSEEKKYIRKKNGNNK